MYTAHIGARAKTNWLNMIMWGKTLPMLQYDNMKKFIIKNVKNIKTILNSIVSRSIRPIYLLTYCEDRKIFTTLVFSEKRKM